MASFLAHLTKPSVTNEPPPPGEQWRNDIAVLVILVFALFLGYGIRNNALFASRTVELGDGLPALKIPRGWTTGAGDEYVLEARNPRSASVFDPQVKVAVRPLKPGETLGLVRTGLGVQRAQALLRYRELSADPVRVAGRDGLLVTYAYVDDPTRAAGALAPPVVVMAQDLIFLLDDRAMIVTTAADAAGWSQEQFRVVYDSLRLSVQDVSMVPESPLAAPTPAPAGGFQSEEGRPAGDGAATDAQPDATPSSEEGDK